MTKEIDELQRKFIEYDLPLEDISKESAKEKNIRHGHPSTLHIWWARRPLASSRATTLAALLDDPGKKNQEEREEIYELIREITPWDSVKEGNSECIELAKERIAEENNNNPKILDPFAGGGAIPFEAARLGCDTYSSDYNPVAAFIEKATIEWPSKFGFEIDVNEKLMNKIFDNNPEEEEWQNSFEFEKEQVSILPFLVEKWARKILKEVRGEINGFFPECTVSDLKYDNDLDQNQVLKPIGYLWARMIPCQNPSCEHDIPLLGQFWLAKKKKRKVAMKPSIEEGNISFEIYRDSDLEKLINEGFEPSDGTVSRGSATCLFCNQVTESDDVKKLGKNGDMNERLIACVYKHPEETGKKYKIATQEDRNAFIRANETLENKVKNWPFLENPLPDEELSYDPRNLWCQLYGVTEFKDLFNSRQLLSLLTFVEKIKQNRDDIGESVKKISENTPEKINKEQLTKAVIGYLGILVSKCADYNSKHCLWANHGEYVAHTFSRQAIPMSWDYYELNLVGDTGGDWKAQLDWVLWFLNRNELQNENCKVQKQSATDLDFEDNYFDAVLTDPPYYDNVPYAALSDFFYVWLKRILGDTFPTIFSTPTVPKNDEAIMEPTRHENKEDAKLFFEDMLSDSFNEMARVLKPGGISVIVYAHKTTEGWETMLNSLLEAGLLVTASWPIHTESTTRLRAAQSAALASSIYMVCRKVQQKEQTGYFNDIKSDIRSRIHEKLNQFWKEGIKGGDFFISAIGPAMEEFSKYKEVKRYSGEQVDSEELLTFIRSIASDFLAEKLLEKANAQELDESAQFYLTYRWTFLDNKVEFDDASRIAKAEGIDMENYYGGFIKKGRKYINLLGPHERDKLDDLGTASNMVDTLHRACYLWQKDDRDELTRFLSSSPHARNDSFWQFAQAVSETLPEDKKEKQWLEGLLVQKDSYIEGEYSESSPAEVSGQEELFEDK